MYLFIYAFNKAHSRKYFYSLPLLLVEQGVAGSELLEVLKEEYWRALPSLRDQEEAIAGYTRVQVRRNRVGRCIVEGKSSGFSI